MIVTDVVICSFSFTTVAISVSIFFFFFQAEDGIRDYKVTGVQTCALPISNSCAQIRLTSTRAVSGLFRLTIHCATPRRLSGAFAGGGENAAGKPGSTRSGERRVGEEWRSRWSPYH